MRITELHIERYGVWHDLGLRVPESGLSVFYGPNEAGKTTLLRFVRGLLFGFAPSLRLAGATRDNSSGRQASANVRPAGELPRAGGLMRFEAAGRSCEIRRAAGAAGSDELGVGGLPGGEAADRLAELLGGCDETLFSHVFALGLHELQELASLEADEVARHIYGMTLGPQARRLLSATDRLHAEREKLFAADGRSGRLAELLRRDHELAEAQRGLPDFRQRHQQLTSQRRALEARIAEFQERQAGYHSQLRGHVFLERVHSPWTQVRECEAELERLPVVSAFPDGGLKRLDELDAELDSLRRCRDALSAEANEFQERARALVIDPQAARHQATLQSLVEQQPWVEETARQAATAEARVAALHSELEQQRSVLGNGWTDGRLDAIDTSAAARARLTEAARDYRAAQGRWKVVRRRYDRLNKTTRQREADLDARLKEHGARTVPEALAAARAQLADLEALAGLRLREAELDWRGRGLAEQLEQIDERMALPKWVSVVLAVFAAFGVLFALMGLLAGVTSSVISGAAYAFIGATCGISAWALKTHFEREVRERVERLEDDRRANDVSLRETRQEIARLVRHGAVPADAPANPEAADGAPATPGDSGGSRPFQWEDDAATVWESEASAGAVEIPGESAHRQAGASPAPVSDDTVDELPLHGVLNTERFSSPGALTVPADCSEAAPPVSRHGESAPNDTVLIRQAMSRVAELERLAEVEQQIRLRRRRLTELRTRMPGVQRQLSAARQAWCDAVRRTGLAETVEIREALDTWRHVARVQETRQRLAEATAERDRQRQIVEAYRRRISQLGRQLHGQDAACDDPVQVLLEWGEELDGQLARAAERRRLRREERRRRREARDYERQITGLETRRSALLVQGGAASREEFERRADWLTRRRETQELLELAQAELDVAARTEVDLAVVEEDLLAFDAAENRESMDMINLELEDLQREAQSAFEEQGRLKQEIHELETDRRSSRVRFDRAQIEAELIDAAQRWCAIDRASRVVDRMREVFERTCQPETLAAASRYLERLTGGRYHNIWTPLGQRRLSIDDGHGRSCTVEELSGGTREQLFLAVRLAMVEKLAGKGLELPMVLDDVLVNFDQARTEAAVETLVDFAAGGRQVLFFTCHRHLAELFQARGLEPNWLPEHARSVGCERRAG
ncbi:MAG TPA: AAA family ATPase [Planctomycetaceae bacterium]|nr:AAA family ATPase [Planctomycetaceae bacterium]